MRRRGRGGGEGGEGRVCLPVLQELPIYPWQFRLSKASQASEPRQIGRSPDLILPGVYSVSRRLPNYPGYIRSLRGGIKHPALK